jgi:putative transposase
VQFILTSSAVQSFASGLLIAHLGLRDYKRCCTASTLLAILFTACSRLGSLFAACSHLRDAPSHETARKALHANLPDLGTLEGRLNEALAACIDRPLRRHLSRARRTLAIDLHLKPYHGQPQAGADELVRGQAKSGTSHFHAYATAYLVLRGQRFTLALTYVRAGEKMDEVVRRLMRRCAALQVNAGLVLLDRGFWSVAVIRYLMAARYPFLMPVIARGKKADRPGGPSGTMAFQYWRKGGWSEYTLKEAGKKGEKARSAKVKIGVHVRYRAGRRGKHGKERLVYAFWGWQPSGLLRMSEVYRGRFGIETSYRQLNEAKAKTCSRSPSVRLLLVGVALVLRNVWVYLHHAVLSTPRRGKRLYNWERLRFRALLGMLQHEAEKLFGVNDQAATQRPIPKGLAS